MLTACQNNPYNATQLQTHFTLVTCRRFWIETARNGIHQGYLYACKRILCINSDCLFLKTILLCDQKMLDYWTSRVDKSSLESSTFHWRVRLVLSIQCVQVLRKNVTRNNSTLTQERTRHKRYEIMVWGAISIGGRRSCISSKIALLP